MNEVELLACGDALARTSAVLRPDEHVSFRDYLSRALRSEMQIAALFGEKAFRVFVDGRPVEGPESTLPVTAKSRVVLYRRQGPALERLHAGRGQADLLELTHWT